MVAAFSARWLSRAKSLAAKNDKKYHKLVRLLGLEPEANHGVRQSVAQYATSRLEISFYSICRSVKAPLLHVIRPPRPQRTPGPFF
jgi:hypothetical protein